MASILEGKLASIVHKALGQTFLRAVLERDVVASGTAFEKGSATVQTFECRAIEETYGTRYMNEGLVDKKDIRVLVLAASLAIEPRPLDRITVYRNGVAGVKVMVVPEGNEGVPPVQSDPARAVWDLRCRT